MTFDTDPPKKLIIQKDHNVMIFQYFIDSTFKVKMLRVFILFIP